MLPKSKTIGRSIVVYTNPKPTLDESVGKSLPSRPQESSTEDNLGYRKSEDMYFAFIDTLGFQQTFDENRQDTKQEFAQRYRNTFLYFGALMNNANCTKSNTTNAGQTSDSLFFYTDRIDFLLQFIKIYSHFSIYAMSENVFFRGGIAKGSLFINSPTQFYGDCVIKAYLLESEIAIVPCIALDNKTYLDLKESLEPCEQIQALGKSRHCLRPFINVSRSELQEIVNLDPDAIKDIDSEVWEKVHNNIQDNIDKYEFSERVRQKYIYLAENIEKFEANGIT